MLKSSTAGETATPSELLEGVKQIGIYFSAHWCPPCRNFTPILAKKYKEEYAGKGLEIVFVSSDKNDEEMRKYFAEMPWKAVPHGSAIGNSLKSTYEIRGIPSLVIIDADGKLVTKDGRTKVMNGSSFPFSA